MNKIQLKNLKRILLSMLLFGLTACATGGIMDKDSYPVHSFSFDTLNDNPDAEVLDYQYSNSRHVGIRPERERVAMGEVFRGEEISGSILRGDFLFVKWRIKKPGTLLPEYLGTYEDRVDLRSRLPADITELRIHFVIKGTQLYVYLIWPYDEKHEYPLGELKNFGRVKQMQIYPDQLK